MSFLLLLYHIFEIKVDCCIALPVYIMCTQFCKNRTLKAQVTRWRTLETLNRVFSTSQKWDLPGSSTKRFNCSGDLRKYCIALHGLRLSKNAEFSHYIIQIQILLKIVARRLQINKIYARPLIRLTSVFLRTDGQNCRETTYKPSKSVELL